MYVFDISNINLSNTVYSTPWSPTLNSKLVLWNSSFNPKLLAPLRLKLCSISKHQTLKFKLRLHSLLGNRDISSGLMSKLWAPSSGIQNEIFGHHVIGWCSAWAEANIPCTVPTYYHVFEYFYMYNQCLEVWKLFQTKCSLNRDEHRVLD